ncbi:MAG TPA: T9SS type A sorting domain-containing protein, partial [Chitinophagales bacterium]|nr:T9SS type A sorting domain-containing protein [Chitinophagales bacterium]
RVTIQFNVATSEKIEVNLVDLSGKILKQEFFGHLTKGLYNKTIHLDGLASGAYNLVVRSNNEIIERTIVKF